MTLIKLTAPTHFWRSDDWKLHKLFPAGTLVEVGVGERLGYYYVLHEPIFVRSSYNPDSMRQLSPLEVLATCAGNP